MNSINPEWEVSVQETKTLLADSSGDILLLDVRKPEEHRYCRLQGSVLMPMADLPIKLDELRELSGGKQIIAYCHHGIRSRSAAALLRDAGLSVRSMAGGIDRWSEQIDPSIPRY